jgi:hypothetical protein
MIMGFLREVLLSFSPDIGGAVSHVIRGKKEKPERLTPKGKEAREGTSGAASSFAAASREMNVR